VQVVTKKIVLKSWLYIFKKKGRDTQNSGV